MDASFGRAMGLWSILGAAACSSKPSRPAELGDCVASADSGCAVVSVVGGSGGGGTEAGAGPGGCAVNPNDSQCNQCASTNCCMPLVACTQATGCQNLMSCEQTCAGNTSCSSSCQTQFPTGVSPLSTLVSCLDIKCAVCTASGVGDPCAAQSCQAGLACSGHWCSKPCTRSSDCAGIGPNGGNVVGQVSSCMAGTRGLTCVPGCLTDADCQVFPATYCLATTSADGTAVRVCASFPDAGAGGG